MREDATSLERQPLALYRDFNLQPVRKHGEPWSEVPVRNVDAGHEGRRMRKPGAPGDRSPRAEISIANGKERLDLTLSRRIDALFGQQPSRILAGRKHKVARTDCAITRCHVTHVV